MANKNSGSNQRRSIRFRDPDNTVVNLIERIDGEEIPLVGLIINESFKGIACIYVGGHEIERGSEIFWKEAENIETLCEVIRCKEVEESVYTLALRIKE